MEAGHRPVARNRHSIDEAISQMPRSLPPLNSLRTFEAAARLGSFTKAARELNVTPAAVSHQIRGLEEYIGVTLFRRTTRSLVLTDQATAAADMLHEAFDRIGQSVESLSADFATTVAMAMGPRAPPRMVMTVRGRAAAPTRHARGCRTGVPIA